METILSLGLWIKRRRKALDLTQDDLAHLVGCSLETIRKIEGDARRPSRQIAALLAEHLALPPEERDDFIRCARAELSADRLPPPARSVARAAFVAATLPPAPTPDQRRTNLPAQPNALVGREREIAEVTALLRSDDVRLLTLTGPGGTGKTRLALAAAAELARWNVETFERSNVPTLGEGLCPDSVFFVNLAPIRDPALVLPTIAQTLGVIEVGGQPLEQRLKAFLRAKHTLLLLDNFEQVIDAAPHVTQLLAAAPGLKVLVTSRATLHVYGEHEYAVPPLALPPTTDHRRPSTDDALDSVVGGRWSVVTQYESVRLFIDRARAAKADFAVTNENAPAVAEICHRLDGLPLAIELAAARVKIFPPEALLARLGHSLQFLTGGPRDLPARQQTLRNTIEWSYNLLDEDEQALFRRLGVFVGGCTLEAAEAVLRTEGRGLSSGPSISVLSPQSSVLEGLASLMDKNLLRQEEGVDGEPRFVMLETVREYALERLRLSGEEDAARQRHAEYFLALAEKAEPALKGPEQVAWLDLLDREIDDIRTALVWGLDYGNVETTARLGAALVRFWDLRAHHTEGLRWMETVIARSDLTSPRVRAKALYAAGCILGVGASLETCRRAQPYLDQSLTLYRAMGDRQGTADTLFELGALSNSLVNYSLLDNQSRPTALLEESLSLFQALGDKSGSAWALMFLGATADDQRDHATAHLRFTESLTLMREAGDHWGRSWALMFLGGIAQTQGDYTTAWALQKERLAVERALHNKSGVRSTLLCLGQLAFAQGHYALARTYVEEALVISRETGYANEVAHTLDMLGDLALTEQDYPMASARFEEMLALYRDTEDRAGVAESHIKLGYLAWRQGDNRQAAALFEESLRLYRDLVDSAGSARARYWLGCLAAGQGDQMGAAVLLGESLALFEESYHYEGRAICLAELAAVATSQGQQARAARLCGAAERLATNHLGTVWSIYRQDTPWSIYQAQYARTIAGIHAQLGEATFAAAWAEGQKMTSEQAIAEALDR